MGKRGQWVVGLLAAAVVAGALLAVEILTTSVSGGSPHCAVTRHAALPALTRGATAQDYYSLVGHVANKWN
jgi:hypothetical protein